MSERCAYVIYDAKVVFTVDLDSGRVESADAYANSLRHFDTGFSFKPGSAAEWLRLQLEARSLIGAHRPMLPLRWNDEV